VRTRTGRWLLSLVLMIPLLAGVFTSRADAQVVVRVGPTNHYHQHRYRHVYYDHYHHAHYHYYYR
jgi:hypothetical protein